MVYRGAALLIAIGLGVAGCSPSKAGAAETGTGGATQACAAFDRLAGHPGDAAPALSACLASVPAGGDVALAPGRYVLRSRVVIRRPVTLHSARFAATGAGCRAGGDPRCATLVMVPGAADRSLPFAVLAAGTHLDALVFEGGRAIDPAAVRAACGSDRKPAGGGLQVQGDGITVSRSVLEAFGCYTALEYEGGRDTHFVGNVFADNGTHDGTQSWPDGLTIHDGQSLLVSGNSFTDNTDVQLIFGGCRDCIVRGNRFRHSGRASGGAFADLMLHAWPKATSGDFTGTVVSANDVDCSPAKRCGFGLMIGASPWYAAPTFGGRIVGNRIADAIVGINVNDLTGAMQISGNHVVSSGGAYASTCGTPAAPAINVSPASRRYVDAARVADAGPVGGASFASCLFNYPQG